MREMKESGIEWIGEIPADWNIVPLTKQLESIVDYRGKTPEKTDDGVFLVTAKNVKDGKICYELSKEYVKQEEYDEIMHRGLPQIGDVLFTTEAPLGQVANVDRIDIALAQRIIKFRTLDKLNPFFLKYWIMNQGFQQFLQSLSTGSTAAGIKSGKLFMLPIVIMDREQQDEMVIYLDAKCSQIDAIIEKQQTIIEKLKEYKLSMINEVSNVKEGISCHLGFISQMKNGLNFTDTLEGIRIKFLGVGDFKQYFFLDNEEQFSTVITESDISEDYYLKDGDIVFVRSNGSKELVGRAVMVNNISFPLTYSGFCIRFRNIRPDIIDSRFLLYYFRSPDFRKQLEKYSQGSNISNMNQDLLSRMSFTIPSMEYQKDALEQLEIKCKKIDEKVDNTELFINKLMEYKKSLIYEVVTGKKEV